MKLVGGLLFAADTREPHSRSSLLVSSLWHIVSIKQKLSFCVVVAVWMAAVNSASLFTCIINTTTLMTLSEVPACFAFDPRKKYNTGSDPRYLFLTGS